jgi:hypothetical protein
VLACNLEQAWDLEQAGELSWREHRGGEIRYPLVPVRPSLRGPPTSSGEEVAGWEREGNGWEGAGGEGKRRERMTSGSQVWTRSVPVVGG